MSPRADVLDSGYKWDGELYPTLTHISMKATGYQIGGNNFFGLLDKLRSYLHISHFYFPHRLP